MSYECHASYIFAKNFLAIFYALETRQETAESCTLIHLKAPHSSDETSLLVAHQSASNIQRIHNGSAKAKARPENHHFDFSSGSVGRSVIHPYLHVVLFVWLTDCYFFSCIFLIVPPPPPAPPSCLPIKLPCCPLLYGDVFGLGLVGGSLPFSCGTASQPSPVQTLVRRTQ